MRSSELLRESQHQHPPPPFRHGIVRLGNAVDEN